MQELRSQLSRSAGMVGEFSQLKHELEKSEKQRHQLSDHIQVCTAVDSNLGPVFQFRA